MTAKQWVLATQNKGKCKEFNHRLVPLGVQIRPLSEWTDVSVEEDGASFVENALIKARYAARVTGLPALADDSGLCVPALGGRPGLYSSRFAGEGASDAQNNAHLLEALQGIEDRRAYFHCTLVMVRCEEDMAPVVCQGEWHGVILTAPQGKGGFGYDPLFVGDGLSQTAAELTPDEKAAVSHRGRALKGLLTFFRSVKNV